MQVAVKFQNEIIFTYFKKIRKFVLSTSGIMIVNIDSSIKKGGRKLGAIKTIFYEDFNLEKGFRKDHSAKPKASENCSLF